MRFTDASLVLVSPHEVPHSCVASFVSFWVMEKKIWSGVRTSGHSELVGGGKKFHHASRGLLLSYPCCQSLLSGFHQCSKVMLTCAARDFVSAGLKEGTVVQHTLHNPFHMWKIILLQYCCCTAVPAVGVYSRVYSLSLLLLIELSLNHQGV